MIYSLPRRDSIYGVHHVAVGCGVKKTAVKAKIFGENELGLCLSKVRSGETSYERMDGSLGVGLEGHGNTSVAAGTANCSVSVGCSNTETRKEIFLVCAFGIHTAPHVDGTGEENFLHVAPLGLNLPNSEPETTKHGSLSADSCVTLSAGRMNADAKESVSARPGKELASALSLTGAPVAGRWARLRDIDPESLSALDNAALNELEFIEER